MPTALSTKRILFDHNHSCVYHPQADTSTALKELHLTPHSTTYPEAAFIVAGDFNKANLKTRLHKLYQNIECASRAGIDHCYSNFRDTYKALTRHPLMNMLIR
jgi:hypothetical protein